MVKNRLWLFVLAAGIAAAPCSAAMDSGQITGKVLGPGGKPVKAATVSCRPTEQHWAGDYVPPVAEATTREDGSFNLTGVPPGDYLLDGYADGFADGFVWCYPRIGRVSEEITIKLSPAADIRGRVVDGAGKPLPGVQLYFVDSDCIASRPVVTAPDGSFLFTYGPLEGVRVQVQKDGYNPYEIYVAKAESKARKKPYEVVLICSPVITGVVTNAATGKPLAGTSVYCMQTKEPVTTDEDGRYRFDDLGAGVKAFAAVAPGLSTRRLVAARLEDDKVTTLDLALHPSRPIKGVILDDRTGRPVADGLVMVGLGFAGPEEDEPPERTLHVPGEEGAIKVPAGVSTLEALRGARNSPIIVRSDEKGKFTIPLSFPEMLMLLIFAEDYYEEYFQLADVDLSKPLEIRLDEGRVIIGRVLDHNGAPAPAVTVYCGAGFLVEKRLTGNEGRFRIGGLLPGRYEIAAVDRVTHRHAGGEVEIKRRRVAEVELSLLTPGFISGRVTDKQGNPVSDACISFYTKNVPHVVNDEADLPESELEFSEEEIGPYVVDDPSFWSHHFGSAELGRSVCTDMEGRFVSGPVLPGTCVVSISLPAQDDGPPGGFRPTHEDERKPPAEPKTIELPPGGTVREVNFVVKVEKQAKPEEPKAAVSGKVVDTRGKPIPGAHVKDATTDDRGRFLVTGLRPGARSIDAYADGYLSGHVLVRAPAENVTVKLWPAGRIVGKVVDAETGETIEDFGLSYWGPAEADPPCRDRCR